MRIKYIPGQGGKYSITDDGRVYCHGFTIRVKSRYGNFINKTYKPRWLATNTNRRGDWYMSISIGGGKNRKGYKIHRLIANAFIPNPKGLPEVNHKNGIKTDNRIDNLEWCTRQQNIDHSWEIAPNRKQNPSKGEANPNSKLTECNVRDIRRLASDGTPKFEIARKFGVTRTMVRFIVSHRSWAHVQ